MNNSFVMAGLDPAIHALLKYLLQFQPLKQNGRSVMAGFSLEKMTGDTYVQAYQFPIVLEGFRHNQ